MTVAVPSARSVIEAVADPRSFVSWDAPLDTPSSDGASAEVRARARERSGADESVVTGEARVAGQPVALIVGEFGFLAGSVGRDAAERVISAVSRATRSRLPILASTASGGTRMHEGTPAFVRMVDIGAAIGRHRSAGLPYLVHLRHPTTGGVLASWGGLGQVTLAEPGALVGFLGPRVVEVLTGLAMPDGIQTSENLHARGFVDSIVPIEGLRDQVSRILCALAVRVHLPDDPRGSSSAARPSAASPGSVWDAVLATRQADRISLDDIYDNGVEVVAPLAGTGVERAAVQVRLVRLGGISCVLIAQERRAHPALGPQDLAAAERGAALAEEWGLPLVTVVDTPGAELSAAAENGGLAIGIARCMAAMQRLTVPSVALLLGQGGGGGALALLAARRIVAAQHAWLAPLPPEGASVILHRDEAYAAQVAEQQRIGSAELHAIGFVDVVVPEPACQSAAELARALCAEVAIQIRELAEL